VRVLLCVQMENVFEVALSWRDSKRSDRGIRCGTGIGIAFQRELLIDRSVTLDLDWNGLEGELLT
jgi:hypothetical protein